MTAEPHPQVPLPEGFDRELRWGDLEEQGAEWFAFYDYWELPAEGWIGIGPTHSYKVFKPGPADVQLLQMIRRDLGLTTSRKEHPEPDPYGDVADVA